MEENVIRLLDKADEFYEGAYENQVFFVPRSERLWHVWPLWLINSGYPWAVRHYVPAKSIIIELGCASGVRYFSQRYRMVGCDLSLSSLKKLGSYELRIQADAAQCIPLPNNSVEAVVSSYFWEHIPPEIKPGILTECQRILRPGGKVIFLYDVETDNPLISYYKTKDPELYEQLFIAGDGHLGYQNSEENLEIFRKAGFRVLAHKGMEKTWLQSTSAYTKLERFGGLWASLFASVKIFGRSPWFYPYTALMRAFDTIICPFLPASWARIDLVILEKENT